MCAVFMAYAIFMLAMFVATVDLFHLVTLAMSGALGYISFILALISWKTYR